MNQNEPNNTELATEQHTEKFGDDVAVTTENPVFDEFADNTMSGIEQQAQEQLEALSEAAAAAIIKQGASAIIGMVNMISGAQIKMTSVELDCLAEDLAPLLMKYGANPEQMPAWLKFLWKYRTELIAIKGIVFFSLSIGMQVKAHRQQLRIEAAKARAEAKAQAEAKYRQQQDDLPMAA